MTAPLPSSYGYNTLMPGVRRAKAEADAESRRWWDEYVQEHKLKFPKRRRGDGERRIVRITERDIERIAKRVSAS